MVVLVVDAPGCVQVRGTLAERAVPAEREIGAGGAVEAPSASTVTVTAAEVVLAPLLSVATAVKEWLPVAKPV